VKLYHILMWNAPQALQDLDRYQLKHYGCHIEEPIKNPEPELKVPVHTEDEDIDRFMRQPPSRSRR